MRKKLKRNFFNKFKKENKNYFMNSTILIIWQVVKIVPVKVFFRRQQHGLVCIAVVTDIYASKDSSHIFDIDVKFIFSVLKMFTHCSLSVG